MIRNMKRVLTFLGICVVGFAADEQKAAMVPSPDHWAMLNAKLETIQAKAEGDLALAREQINAKYKPQADPIFAELNTIRAKACEERKIAIEKCEIDAKGNIREAKPPSPGATK